MAICIRTNGKSIGNVEKPHDSCRSVSMAIWLFQRETWLAQHRSSYVSNESKGQVGNQPFCSEAHVWWSMSTTARLFLSYLFRQRLTPSGSPFSTPFPLFYRLPRCHLEIVWQANEFFPHWNEFLFRDFVWNTMHTPACVHLLRNLKQLWGLQKISCLCPVLSNSENIVVNWLFFPRLSQRVQPSIFVIK